MIPDRVVLRAHLEFGHDRSLLRRTHNPVVNADTLGKGPRLPAIHPRADHRNVINTTALDRLVAANVLVALPPEQLAPPPNILYVRKAIIVLKVPFPERRPEHPQCSILRRPGKQELKVITL